MNPLNSITGTIVAGFVLALILGVISKMVMSPSSSAKSPSTKVEQPK